MVNLFFNTTKIFNLNSPYCTNLINLTTKTVCYNIQIAALFSILSRSHVLQYYPYDLNLNALHFRHSYTHKRGYAKIYILTQPLYHYKQNIYNSPIAFVVGSTIPSRMAVVKSSKFNRGNTAPITFSIGEYSNDSCTTGFSFIGIY